MANAMVEIPREDAESLFKEAMAIMGGCTDRERRIDELLDRLALILDSAMEGV